MTVMPQKVLAAPWTTPADLARLGPPQQRKHVDDPIFGPIERWYFRGVVFDFGTVDGGEQKLDSVSVWKDVPYL